MSFFSSLPLFYELIIYMVSSFAVSGILTYAGIWGFKKMRVLDHPERYEHEKHRQPIPYSLGIILFIGFLLLSAVFFDFWYTKLLIILLFGWLVSVVSFLDDMETISLSKIHISPAFRLWMQVLVGILVGATSIKIGYVSGLFGDIISLTNLGFNLWPFHVYPIPLLFTVVWYVLVFNAINWSDGLPWIASGFSLVTLLILAVLTLKLYFIDPSGSSQENSVFVLKNLSILIPSVAILAYLDSTRKLIIGDSGTMFLAFMIATLSIISGGKIATVATVLGLYLVDAMYVIFARLKSGKNPLKGDRIHHLHFRLLKLGLSPAFIRTGIFILSFLFGMAVIFLDRTGKIILFVIIVVMSVLFSKILSKIKK